MKVGTWNVRSTWKMNISYLWREHPNAKRNDGIWTNCTCFWCLCSVNKENIESRNCYNIHVLSCDLSVAALHKSEQGLCKRSGEVDISGVIRGWLADIQTTDKHSRKVSWDFTLVFHSNQHFFPFKLSVRKLYPIFIYFLR